MAPRRPADFRERLVAACDAGLAPGEAARLFRVDLSTVYRWRRRARRGESLPEHQARLATTTGIALSPSHLSRLLRRLRLPLDKSR